MVSGIRQLVPVSGARNRHQKMVNVSSTLVLLLGTITPTLIILRLLASELTLYHIVLDAGILTL